VAAALGLVLRGEHVSEQRQRQARAAAARSVPAVLSYRPATVESALKRERTLLGEPFADDFATLVRDDIAPTARKRGITTRATVVSNGVSLVDGRSVTLLMFVNVATTERASKEPVVTGSRLKVTMRQDGDRWLIVGLDPV
jgi:Mce-associated membrane protein